MCTNIYEYNGMIAVMHRHINIRARVSIHTYIDTYIHTYIHTNTSVSTTHTKMINARCLTWLLDTTRSKCSQKSSMTGREAIELADMKPSCLLRLSNFSTITK